MAQEINARIFGVTLEHPFFSYLQECEKDEIRKEIMDKKSHIISIERDGEVDLAAVISIEPNAIHMREAGGNFARNQNYLEKYCAMFGKFMHKEFITFCIQHKTLIKLALKNGYEQIPGFPDEYRKAI